MASWASSADCRRRTSALWDVATLCASCSSVVEGLDLTSRAVSSAALVASCDFGMLCVRLRRICLDSPLVGYSMQSAEADILDYFLYVVRGVALQ